LAADASESATISFAWPAARPKKRFVTAGKLRGQSNRACQLLANPESTHHYHADDRFATPRDAADRSSGRSKRR
jgi:hypothetical protein